jgi:hypothetical protein
MNRLVSKENKKELIKCKYCDNPAKDNGCCEKHQRQYKYDENIKNGIRCCSRFMRCENILQDGYNGKTCEKCRKEDKKLRQHKSDVINEYNEQHENNKKKCKKCGKIIENEIIYSNGKISAKCKH